MQTLTAEHEAIRSAYEDFSIPLEEIAKDRGMELSIVKASLLQSSSKFRKDFQLSEQEGLDFSNDDLRQMNEIILNTAKYAEDENLRFKAATYVRDDKKGRKELQKAVQNNTFNLLEWNEKFQQSQNKAESIIKKALNIDVQVA